MNFVSKVVVLSALVGFGVSANTAVAEIPELALKADYDGCVAKAGASPYLSTEQVDNYCSCVTVGMKRNLTAEQYVGMSMALDNKQTDSDSVTALKKIAAECLIKTLQ